MADLSGGFPPIDQGQLAVDDIGRLLLHCGDRPGLVAAVSTFLSAAGANIISLDQHATAQSGGTFMQRTIFHLPGLAARGTRSRVVPRTGGRTVRHGLPADRSRQAQAGGDPGLEEDHCLLDLLWRNRRGELDMSVVMVISNHADLADQVRPFGVPFLHVRATPDSRADAERRQLELLQGNVDLVVLARYMQILSGRSSTRSAAR